MNWFSSTQTRPHQALLDMLSGLQDGYPDLAAAGERALAAGYAPAQVGVILAGQLSAWQSRMNIQAAQEMATLEAPFRQQETRLRLQVQESERRMQQAAAETKQLQAELSQRDQLIAELQTTIVTQNRLIAKQHQELTNLLSADKL